MKRIPPFFLIVFLLYSCARVGSPIGGDKDITPPAVLGFNIDSSRVRVSQNLKELRIDFDEYVTLKDIQKNLIISPPIKKIKKILPSNLATRFVSIQWEDTLQANTTYNFNFGSSIQDSNEGNPLSYYNFAFSTGEKIDDFYISGEALDALQIGKKDNSKASNVVGLYQDKDSINYKEKPYYIARVDDDGYYELNYLSPGAYRVLAFSDENGNSIYDPETEKVGFKKERIQLDSSISGLKIPLYNSKKRVKSKELSAMEGGVLMVFQGNPENVEVTSLNNQIKNYKVTHRKFSDSVKVWFDSKEEKIGTETSQKLEFVYQTKEKKDTVSVFYKAKDNQEMTIKSNGNLLAPMQEFKFTSNYALDKIEPEKWTLTLDSLTTQTFTAEISKTNPYDVLIKADFKEGQNYQLTVPKETVYSFFNKNEKSYRFDFKSDEIRNYGSVTAKLVNTPSSKFWLQLLNNNEQIAYQKYANASEIKFDFVKPGEYYLRILVDNNENGFWDPADFENEIFAEDAYLFYKVIVARPLWELVEDWDLKDTRKLDVKAKSNTNPSTTNPKDTNPQSIPRNLPVDSPVNNKRLSPGRSPLQQR